MVGHEEKKNYKINLCKKNYFDRLKRATLRE